MATLTQLRSEPWWGRELVPASVEAVFRALCRWAGTNPAGGGTRGNEAHLTGRHRSVEWVLNSAFCSRRSYGTQDVRDRRGNPRHIRAFDVPLRPAQMVAVCRRLDAAVRAGQAPSVAEWFGTVDNRTVTGWYEGRPSSSDDSHLTHVHIGLWTEHAADDHTALFKIVTGDEMATWTDRHAYNADAHGWATSQMLDTYGVLGGADPTVGALAPVPNRLVAAVKQIIGDMAGLKATAAADELRDQATLAALEALKANGGVDVAPAVEAIRALRDEAAGRFTALEEEITRLREALTVAETERAELAARLAAAYGEHA